MNILKNITRRLFPSAYNLFKKNYYFFYKFLTGKEQNEIIFEKIYRTNSWNNQDSKSGSGSNLLNTETIRNKLPLLINDLKVKTLLDIPCGDFFWMKNVELNINKYIGADIVREIIENNKQTFENEKRKFVYLDLLKDDIPKADMILCRDCLPHFSFKDIFAALEQIKKSGSEYLLTSTYINQDFNKDILTGLFRRINLQIEPINFPPPLKLIEDKCISERETLEDKYLGLWKISGIKL